MDANRNLDNLMNNTYLDEFLGISNWRFEWKKNKMQYSNFGEFVVDTFNSQMINIGFIGLDKSEFVKISEPKRSCPLYHLAFYSKHSLGKKFWKEAIKISNPQTILDL
jgi:hypothetical protein